MGILDAITHALAPTWAPFSAKLKLGTAMKVFLDDERIAPGGWTQVRWPEEAIALLNTGEVSELSLDHDLGDDAHGTGYDVLKWIEEAVATRKLTPPTIHIHTANPAARVRMKMAADMIQRMAERNCIPKQA